MWFLKELYRRARYITEDVCDQTNRLYQAAINSTVFTETIQFHVGEFIEGFKSIVNFPFTTVKMIFDPNARRLASHAISYNFTWYLLPVVAYNGFIRNYAQVLLEGTVGENYVIVLDILANGYFLRAATNAFAINIFNNVNASNITLREFDTLPVLKCDCKESKHLKAKLMGPVYYTSKIGTVVGAEQLAYLTHYFPYPADLSAFGTMLNYTLKPLVWGQAINEANLSELCYEHRIHYNARHNTAHYGMGMAVMASTKIASSLIFYFTGVSGFFVDDALYSLLYIFMLFHIHNQDVRQAFKDDTPRDVFRPLRSGVDRSLSKARNFVLSLEQNKNSPFAKLCKSMGQFFKKPSVRRVFLYKDFGDTPEQLVTFAPIHLLLVLSQNTIREKLATVDMITSYPNLVANFLIIYQWLPLVPPKEHAPMIVGILTNDVDLTNKVSGYIQELLKIALKHNPDQRNRDRVRVYGSTKALENRLIDDYLKTKENETELPRLLPAYETMASSRNVQDPRLSSSGEIHRRKVSEPPPPNQPLSPLNSDSDEGFVLLEPSEEPQQQNLLASFVMVARTSPAPEPSPTDDEVTIQRMGNTERQIFHNYVRNASSHFKPE